MSYPYTDTPFNNSFQLESSFNETKPPNNNTPSAPSQNSQSKHFSRRFVPKITTDNTFSTLQKSVNYHTEKKVKCYQFQDTQPVSSCPVYQKSDVLCREVFYTCVMNKEQLFASGDPKSLNQKCGSIHFNDIHTYSHTRECEVGSRIVSNYYSKSGWWIPKESYTHLS